MALKKITRSQLPSTVSVESGFKARKFALEVLDNIALIVLSWPLQANLEKTAFILSYLSSKGRIPLLGLNDIISTILQKEKPEQISWLLMQCFYQSRLASNPNTGKPNISP